MTDELREGATLKTVGQVYPFAPGTVVRVLREATAADPPATHGRWLCKAVGGAVHCWATADQLTDR